MNARFATILFIVMLTTMTLPSVSHHAWAKKGRGDGGHGTTPVCVSFSDLPGDGVQSDGIGQYCDSKKAKVLAEIDSDGDFFLEPNNSNTIGGGRNFFVQLDAPVSLTGTGITFQSTDDLDQLGIAHDERLVVVREGNESDIRDFTVGQSERRGVWVQILIENPNGGTTQIAIHFYPNGPGAIDGVTTPGTITRSDQDSWEIEIIGSDVDPENPDTAYVMERFQPSAGEVVWHHHGSTTIPTFTATISNK